MCWISRGKVKVRLTQQIFSYFPCQFLAKTSRHFWYFTAMKIFSSSNFQKETIFKRSLSIYKRAVPGAIDYSPKKKRWPFLNSFSLPHYSLVSVFATFFCISVITVMKRSWKASQAVAFPTLSLSFFMYKHTHQNLLCDWCPALMLCARCCTERGW